ncbi:hypothetical protein ACTQ49_13740 [Luteococcus sp. Sow4_B9]|uniref:hypothetical protein n=1 Tax=Luteococcus sp. Sow4_B9 TaxID=3438792 RepID=UPI003F9EADD2
MPSRSTRTATVTALLALSLMASACGTGESSDQAASTAPSSQGLDQTAAPSPTPTPTPAPELPRGGRSIFPEHRLFGYSGAPGAPGQGRLGIGELDDRMVEMEKRAQPYAKGRTIMPVMELIATTVQPKPGKDGMFRSHVDDAVIEEWLAVARKHRAMLLLNIQPGRSSFPTEIKVYEKWLKEPDVGLALDPEWRMGPDEIPMKTFGHVSAAELNECAQWVSQLVAQHNLPEKVLLYHQLNEGVVGNEPSLKAAKGVVLIKSVDGIGSPGAKTETWKRVVAKKPRHVHPGFKLFYEEDVATGGRLMTPAEVMALVPQPEYVLFE